MYIFFLQKQINVGKFGCVSLFKEASIDLYLCMWRICFPICFCLFAFFASTWREFLFHTAV